MRKIYRSSILVSAFCLLFAGCQTPTTNNTNAANLQPANANSSNANRAVSVNSNAANTNTAAASNAVAVETKEPEAYQATVTLKLETMGETTQNLPAINANVARSGANRRMEFTLPTGEKVVYLDLNGKQLILSPTRKQIAELNKESVGFDVRRLLMPDQIVRQTQSMKNMERVGEEQVNGRTAIKYRYAATTDSKTTAGNVQTESVVFIDKETSLPLRSETVSQSQTGQVKGIKGLRLVTEMSNIQSTATPELFTEPTDYKKVAPEEVRSQLNAIFQVAGALLSQMMQNSQQPAASPAQ